MDRLTKKENNMYLINDGDVSEIVDKLGRFEDLVEELLNEREKLAERLKEFKQIGDKKSYNFRETMGKKLINTSILNVFDDKGML